MEFAEGKLLKRLKLTLWVLTIVMVIQGLTALVQLRELYPLTRWAMFSNIERGAFELREGYLLHYEIRATDINGQEQSIPHTRLGVHVSAATANVTNDAVYAAMNSPDPLVKQESREYILRRLQFIFGVPFEEVEIWQTYYEIDYDQYPYIDLMTPSRSEYLMTFTRDSATMEVQN